MNIKRESMSQWKIRLDVKGQSVAGDLTVSGFATARTAAEVGFVFAEALRGMYEDVTVVGSIEREDVND